MKKEEFIALAIDCENEKELIKKLGMEVSPSNRDKMIEQAKTFNLSRSDLGRLFSIGRGKV